MQTKTLSLALAASLAVGALALAPSADAAGAAAQNSGAMSSDADMATNDSFDCEMDFTLSGWSVFYKSASGQGTVTCANGQSMDVVLNVTGGGLTAGAYEINDGHGNFVDVSNISQVLGTYATATAHAGAVKSARAAVMTNDDVTLTLTGTGNGWNIGVGLSAFSIKRASAAGGND